MSDVLTGTLDEVSAELGDDVTALAMIHCLQQMCERLNEDGWDLPAALFTVERMLPPAELADELRAAVGAQAMMLGFTGLPLPFDGLEGWQVGEVFHSLAHHLRRERELATMMMEGRDVIGWAYTTEGWTAPVGSDDERPFQDRADRIEVRLLNAADRAHRYCVRHIRDGETTIVVDTLDHGPDHDGPDGLVGNIPDALADLADALPIAVP